MNYISVIVGSALAVLCIIIGLYYISSISYVSPPKEKVVESWPNYSKPQHTIGIFRILPYLNRETLEPWYQVQRYTKSTICEVTYYDWDCYWDKTIKIYPSFSSETEAQLFIDSYLETERAKKQKELQYQEFMKNNPPKIYP